jgi:phosphate transport system substrate-binding protein
MTSRRSIFTLFYGLLLALVLAACDQVAVATPQPVTLTIGGSTAMQPVLASLADTFSRENPNVLFDIRGGGSTLGESRVLVSEIDIAASTLLPDEMRSGDAGTDDSPNNRAADSLIHTPIGLDGVAIVVNEQNTVESLTIQQLRELFNGRSLDWTTVDGLGDEVFLVSREDGSGTRALFEERIMGGEAVSLTAVVMPSSADVADYVAKQPLAIGYVSEAYVGPDDTSSNDIRIVAIEGRFPDADLDGIEPYFLTRPLFLVTNGEPTGWSRQFVDFALGPSGQEIVDRYHTRIR